MGCNFCVLLFSKCINWIFGFLRKKNWQRQVTKWIADSFGSSSTLDFCLFVCLFVGHCWFCMCIRFHQLCNLLKPSFAAMKVEVEVHSKHLYRTLCPLLIGYIGLHSATAAQLCSCATLHNGWNCTSSQLQCPTLISHWAAHAMHSSAHHTALSPVHFRCAILSNNCANASISASVSQRTIYRL